MIIGTFCYNLFLKNIVEYHTIYLLEYTKNMIRLITKMKLRIWNFLVSNILYKNSICSNHIKIYFTILFII